MMAAMAIDEDAAQAHVAHLTERDLDRPAVGMRWRVASDRARHAAIETRRRPESNLRFLAAREIREPLPVVGVEKLMRTTYFGVVSLWLCLEESQCHQIRSKSGNVILAKPMARLSL